MDLDHRLGLLSVTTSMPPIRDSIATGLAPRSNTIAA